MNEQLEQLSNSATLYRQAGVDVRCQVAGEGVALDVRGQDVAAPAFIKLVDDYAASDSREVLVMEATLSSHERALVHARAEVLGLLHRSVGQGDARHIEVSKVSLTQ